ncbi:methyltransferase domain-containing protein [Vibrio penaeicida]|uniref:hypothetical protein n=1 Tax=Vibrio penaeicida TaxID=104609 RepID=UPI001CC590DB|nr:hypothetical protein [Vibrio penaeicida]
METVEFNVVRSKSYKMAISNFEGVWKEDLQVMIDYLTPAIGNKILEIGAGSGFLALKSQSLLVRVGPFMLLTHLWSNYSQYTTAPLRT